jgi:hypothetical protein
MKRVSIKKFYLIWFWFVFLFLLSAFVAELAPANERTYRASNCPVTFTVPLNMSLHDVEGWTEPAQPTACRISLTWEGNIASPVPEKSFDDVRLLSDIVLDVKNVPLKDRFDGLHFYSLPQRVLYKGPELSVDARSMGYNLLRTRPIEHFTVKNGEMYVGIQDFIEVYGRSGQRRQSVSYVFLIGNGTYSVDAQVTYDKNRKSDNAKVDSLFELFRSSNFQLESRR